jgi:hypothetical protein
MGKRGGFVVFGLALAFVGCSSSESDPEPTATLEELATSVARVMCASLGGCCTEQGVSFDRETCETEATSRFTEAILDDREAPDTRYDAAIGAECLQAITSLVVCGQLDDGGGVLEACDRILHGDVAPGDACESRDQCQVGPGQSASCVDQGRCVVYTQRSPIRGKLGDACHGTCHSSECTVDTDPQPALEGTIAPGAICFLEDGLYCDTECKPRPKLGEACSGMEVCVADTYCLTQGALTGTCVRRLNNGADCSSHPGGCASHYCDESNFTCAELPGLSETECRRPF